jgi:HPt (histidine-containing phosphotransfer) domain-containing protein
MDNTSAEDQETIREFLVESHENLTRLDQDLVELEKHPHDTDLLGSIFRTIHTIKGACGFLAFSVLEAITHQAETLLSQLRDGRRELNPALVSLILETVDATRKVLAAIETSGKEGSEGFEDLTERLRLAAQLTGGEEPESTSEPNGAGTPPISVAEPMVEKTATKLRDGPTEKEEDRGKKKEGGKEEDVTRSSAAVDANIRVGVGLLDKLMDLVGELVLTRNQILQFNIEREDPALNATSQRLNLITTELQEGVMKTRMQPIGVVWNKLPRVVRDNHRQHTDRVHPWNGLSCWRILGTDAVKIAGRWAVSPGTGAAYPKLDSLSAALPLTSSQLTDSNFCQDRAPAQQQPYLLFRGYGLVVHPMTVHRAGCLLTPGANQWVLGKFVLHSISPSQTHRNNVLNLPVTRVVEQHPTYLSIPEPKRQVKLFSG